MKLFYVVLVILLFYNLGLTLYVFKINRRLKEFNQILYLIFDYPHKHYTFKYFEV